MKSCVLSILTLTLFLLTTTAINAQDDGPSVSTIYNEGLALLKAKSYAEGLDKMEEALKLAKEESNDQVIDLAQKNGSVAANRLGSQNYRSKNYDGALAAYERGIALDPGNSSNLLGKARSLDKKGMLMESIAAFNVASDAYNAEGKGDFAQKALKQAQTSIGKIYLAKDYDQTIAAANKYLEGDDAPEVHYYLAKSLLEKGDNAKALEHSNKAVELSGAEVEDKYFMAQGESLEKNGKTAEALEVYKKVTGEKYKKYADYKIQTLQG